MIPQPDEWALLTSSRTRSVLLLGLQVCGRSMPQHVLVT